MDAPLIVTLRLDDAAQAYFDALRSRYFPPARLFVGAHVTMFHAIPGPLEASLAQAIAASCANTAEFPILVKRLRFLGRGVAYDLTAPEALRLRSALAAPFAGQLTPQDSAPWSPHITIQNKVDAATARETMALLAAMPALPPIVALGVSLWQYGGGPWHKRADFAFRKNVLF